MSANNAITEIESQISRLEGEIGTLHKAKSIILQGHYPIIEAQVAKPKSAPAPRAAKKLAAPKTSKNNATPEKPGQSIDAYHVKVRNRVIFFSTENAVKLVRKLASAEAPVHVDILQKELGTETAAPVYAALNIIKEALKPESLTVNNIRGVGYEIGGEE